MNRVISLKLSEEPNHINRFLTHWTGSSGDEQKAFEILKAILSSQELKFSNCKISHPTSIAEVKTSMICFTNTPIEQSLEHCEHYGFFGISFNKEELIEYGANPVLYFTDSRAENVTIAQGLRNSYNDERQFKYSTLTSYFQPYRSGKKDFDEFNEREWRINRLLPFPYVEQNDIFKEYSFQGKIRREEIEIDGRGAFNFYLKFAKSIIENIVVPTGYQEEIIEILEELGIHCDIIAVKK